MKKLMTILLVMGLLMVPAVTEARRTAGSAPVPVASQVMRIPVTIKNGFALVKLSVFVDGRYWGDVAPLEARMAPMPQGAFVRVTPDLATPADFTVWRPGIYLVYPPCFMCPTAVQYLGES